MNITLHPTNKNYKIFQIRWAKFDIWQFIFQILELCALSACNACRSGYSETPIGYSA